MAQSTCVIVLCAHSAAGEGAGFLGVLPVDKLFWHKSVANAPYGRISCSSLASYSGLDYSSANAPKEWGCVSGRCGWIEGVKMPCKSLGWMGRAARLWLPPVLPLLSHQAAPCPAPFPQPHPLVLAALLGGRGDGASAVLDHSERIIPWPRRLDLLVLCPVNKWDSCCIYSLPSKCSARCQIYLELIIRIVLFFFFFLVVVVVVVATATFLKAKEL